MKNLMDYGNRALAGLVPIVMAAMPIGAQQRFAVPELAVKDNLADYVRSYVVEHGFETTYELSGNKILAKHRRLPGTNMDLIAFEIDEVAYLVVSTTGADQAAKGRSATLDLIDRAPEVGSYVDTLLDEVMRQEGNGPQQKIDLGNSRVNRSYQLQLDASLSSARDKIEAIFKPKR